MKNNYLKVKVILAIVLAIFMSACWNTHDSSENTAKETETKEKLIAINKYLIKKDVELIENTIRRNKWNMHTSKTGLYYEFLKESGNKKIVSGDKITIAYKVYLLDNTMLYSSDSLGAKTFKAGSGGVESGLEEAVLLMAPNDKARFILPPHLAHGLLGDGNKIPPRSCIIYEVEIVGKE